MLKTQAFLIATLPFAIVSLYLIFYGMILISQELPNTSELSQVAIDHKPWFEPKSKVIYVMIDGLRYDYIGSDAETEHIDYWKNNKFTRLVEIMEKNPENSVLLKALVEVPTTTILKLPGTMTGGFPLKISTLRSLGGILPLKEDSVLHQLTKAGRKAYFAGQEMWTKYFPDDLIASPPVNEFDIKDLNVDLQVIDDIKNFLRTKKPDMLIGYFLGIDHQSHYNGLMQPDLAEVKRRIEDCLVEVIGEMDDQTTLVIMGDHGTTLDGRHGGDSYAEMHTPIFAYNKKGFEKYKQPNMNKVMKNDVKQIDIASTLAMLLGVPTPFSNVGQVINDLIPADKVVELEVCPENSFALQAFYHNYETSVQIDNFVDETQAVTQLFKQKDLDTFKAALGEIENDYKAIEKIIEKPEKCKEALEMMIEGTLKCQRFSAQVYDFVKDKSIFDLLIANAGIIGFVLILFANVLTVQYVYNVGYKEQEFSMKSSCLEYIKSRRMKILVAVNIIAAILAWLYNDKIVYPIAACLLITELWFCGSIISSFMRSNSKYSIQNDTESISPITPGDSSQMKKLAEDEIRILSVDHRQDTPPQHVARKGFSSDLDLFLIKTPKETFVTVAVMVWLLYIIHLWDFREVQQWYFNPTVRFVACLFIGIVATKSLPLLICLTVFIVGPAFVLKKQNYWSFDQPLIEQYLGLVLIAQWGWNEICYIRTQFRTGKLFTASQLICFGVLMHYQVNKVHSTHFIEITLPRMIWALMLSTIVIGHVQKIASQAKKRNLQLCLLMFLILLRKPEEIVYFGILLQIMDITTRYFVKVQVKNYLYSIFIGLLGYVGLFYLKLFDYYIIMNFTPAFVGLQNFNIVISSLFYILYLFSSFILATLFISYYNQALDSSLSDKENLPETVSDAKPDTDIVGEAELMKKRNVVLVVFFQGIVMLSACLKMYVLRDEDLDFSLEKYLLDACFYFYIAGCGCFLLKK